MTVLQGMLFDSSEVDLSYITASMTSVSLGKAMLRENRRVGKEKLTERMQEILEQNHLYVPPEFRRTLFFSTCVDLIFKRGESDGSLASKIGTWWKALALDLHRNDLIRDAKTVAVMSSKISDLVVNWQEFSFLVRDLFNNKGGMKFFQGLKHISWLYNDISKETYKLTDLRSSGGYFPSISQATNSNRRRVSERATIKTNEDKLKELREIKGTTAPVDLDEDFSDTDIDLDDFMR